MNLCAAPASNGGGGFFCVVGSGFLCGCVVEAVVDMRDMKIATTSRKKPPPCSWIKQWQEYGLVWQAGGFLLGLWGKKILPEGSPAK